MAENNQQDRLKEIVESIDSKLACAFAIILRMDPDS